MAGERDPTKQIGAWFLGPKAENANLVEEMVLYILRDYFHWRRNYFPSGEITITQHMRRESLEWSDSLFQQLSDMLGGLKRHFPFYSPRYVAHMLSDQTVPSVPGYFAGMLYNPNNVTPEAARVTVEWELEVARDILHMLGYLPPPVNGGHRETRKEFGWAHITSGGTVANLEALWVARTVRYFPLAAKRVAIAANLPFTVKPPGGEKPLPLADLDDRRCLSLRPNEATFLLPRLFEMFRNRHACRESEVAARLWRLIDESGMAIAAAGTAPCYAVAPPALFVAGTAHYKYCQSCGCARHRPRPGLPG